MIKSIFRAFVDNLISKCITPSLQRQGVLSESLIAKAARFVACEAIEGDYLEFGVYQGASFISSFKTLKNAFESRISQFEGSDIEFNLRREEIWSNMRFFAFDSFEGLPKLESSDAGTEDFKQGMYACDIETVEKNISSSGISNDRAILIKGWFSDTCNQKTAQLHNICKASIIWIDGDLYSSTRDVLNFVGNFLQDGTILIFDDWFSYKGNPSRGEQRAFYEWIETPRIKNNFLFQEYQRESWKRISFITSKIQKYESHS